ncbi:MAG: sulfite exporter TauE/SafE family protein [Candidatus Saccharimonadales bacterium]
MLTDIFLLLAGVIVGGMNAIAGGGTLVGFPALLASGLSALSANATSNVMVLPGVLASAFGYRKYLCTVPKRYLLLFPPLLVGAFIGAFSLRHTSSNSFESLVPWLILIAVGLFAFQPFLHRHLHRHLHSKSPRVKPLFWIDAGLLPLAIYGGYFGAGFGFVVLAFLGFTSLKDIHQMNGMKNLAGAAVATVSLLVLAPGQFINWHAGLVMALGSTIGGYGGARLAQNVSSHMIRLLVIAIGMVTIVYLALRHY